ncbi:MAG: short-chain dehydrogenase [Bacteroidetes bacterium]|nr:short-chain dehydrogenase [Bacteroidota bacterium]
MGFEGKTALVLGGAGLVGRAVCRELLRARIGRLVVAALTKSEAEEAVQELRALAVSLGLEVDIREAWGNVMVRTAWKDRSLRELLADPEVRFRLLRDIWDTLDEEIVKASWLYELLVREKPQLVVDCINTATVVAYQDVYTASRRCLYALQRGASADLLRRELEHLLAIQYIPQLIRHVQILAAALEHAGVEVYLKVGTTGTGGMGFNVPYTHSEGRPSRMLLSKSAVAGAHTLLLYLLGRTPGRTIIKELKPAAAVGWKRIAYGPVYRAGKPIELQDCPEPLLLQEGESLSLEDEKPVLRLGRYLEAPFIDVGENGVFARSEFEILSEEGQMEFITPEEIAQAVRWELEGRNTGRDVIDALDAAVLGPTYRAGNLRTRALQMLEALEQQHGVEGVAFEMLGPPRLSKLLWEAYLLRLEVGSLRALACADPQALAIGLEVRVRQQAELRRRILSIGLAILAADGRHWWRGAELKVPDPPACPEELLITAERIHQWAEQGWVDLRPQNMAQWRQRAQAIIAQAEGIGVRSDSAITQDKLYWKTDLDERLQPGKLAAWIFAHEEGGYRMKR